MTGLQKRMADFRPRAKGRVKVPDIGWPPPDQPSKTLQVSRHRTFAERTREMCERAGLDL